jgi:hypothetical protein
MLGNALTALILAAQAAVPAKPAALVIAGLNGRSQSLTSEQLRALPALMLEATDPHGKVATRYGAVTADAVLRLVAAPLGQDLRGPALATYVVVEAADGYKAVFALAEVDPGMTDKKVLLAYERDGQPLGTEAGPLRLVIPDEKRGARWVRQVVRIVVRKAD